jgi:peptide/nickel transport system permease protein
MSAVAGTEPIASTPSRWRDVGRSALQSPTFFCGAAIVLFWVFCALFSSWLTPYDPLSADVINSLLPPSAEHWFGTDQLGRDVFSRVIAGSHDILTVAPLATLLGTAAGASLGLACGYFGGFFDAIVGRMIDAFLALPLIVVSLLALVAIGSSNATVIIVIGLSFTPIIARTVRAAVLGERELEYVTASHLRMEPSGYIMFVEILPNVIAPVLVEGTVRLGYAIFAVATLSFLGFGIQPPSPDWGLSIATNYSLVGNYYWTVLFDALAIASLVIGVNLLAEGFEHAVRD